MAMPEKRDAGNQPAGLTALIVGLWVTAGLDLLYWVLFFTTGEVQSSPDAMYLGFERAFPAADAWLGIAALACAEGLRRRRAWAVLYGIAAGSAFIYLGLMDTLYNLEHGMYLHPDGTMLGEIGINVACFSFGPFLMRYVWRQRRWLDAS
ncbi:MAG: hypothetical protein ACHQ9S_16045 [Candidatus Binatia bacterium]